MANGKIPNNSPKLLWDNPNTSVSFAHQSVNLSDSNYSVFDVLCRYSTQYPYYSVCRVYKNIPAMFSIHNDSGSNTLFARDIVINGSSATFSDCAKYVGADSSTSDNTGCIPTRIYGII